jgi:hypothetical protein
MYRGATHCLTRHFKEWTQIWVAIFTHFRQNFLLTGQAEANIDHPQRRLIDTIGNSTAIRFG